MVWHDDELAQLKATQNDYLLDTATITRSSFVPDGRGGETESTTIVASDVSMRIGEPTYREREALTGRFEGAHIYACTFTAAIDLSVGDTITHNGFTYTVLGLAAPQTIDTARRCYARRAVA